MLPTVEPVIYVHFHYIKTSCFMFSVNYSTTSYVHFIYSRTSCLMFSLNYSRTSYLCSVLTAIEPHV